MKKILIIVLVVAVILACGIVYLNKVLLPTKIRAIVINGLQEITKKKVTLESLQFSIFKGLLLKNLVISDDENTLLSLKEGACTFLIIPVFKKTLIIPTIRLDSPQIYLERRKDKTFNIQDLFPKEPAKTKGGFNIIVYKININGASIRFQDNAILRPFSKTIDNLDLSLKFSLPSSVKFSLTLANIKAAGEYKIPDEQLAAKIIVQDFSPKEYAAYYQDFGLSIPEGKVDSNIDLEFKDKILRIRVEAKDKGLNVIGEKFSAKLNAKITADIQYTPKDEQVKFSGKAGLVNSVVFISGLEFLDKIDNINGQVAFDNSGISTESLSASILGLPVQAKLKVTDFKRPLIDLDVSSAIDLASLQGILKDRFKFAIPGKTRGASKLSLKMHAEFLPLLSLQVNGLVDITSGSYASEQLTSPIDNITGKIEFSRDQLNWQELSFKYQGAEYKTKGELNNFQAPGVQLELSSKDLSLESNFNINNKLIRFSKLSGRYFGSEFSATGNVDAAEPSRLESDFKGSLSLNLEDLKKILVKSAAEIDKIKPQGIISGPFSLNGNLSKWQSCNIQARLTGPSVSAYGLKGKDLLLIYDQQDWIASIPTAHLALYDGTLDAGIKMNLKSENLPYWIEADMRGVKIEKMREDIPMKEKKLSGFMAGHLKLNGYSNNLSLLSGAGNIFITEGKLWELDLFKGLGSVIFIKDFADITFHEASCAFLIKDKYIFTDSLKLKSNIVNLTGSVKIGFDSSLDSALNVEVLSEMVPLSGTFKDVTTAIMGAAERFAVIKITGTLKEPKYVFKPAVGDIIKGIKDIFFRKN